MNAKRSPPCPLEGEGRDTPGRNGGEVGASPPSAIPSTEARGAPARIAHGGKTVYGAHVGLLLLDMEIPRVPGDVGHAATWPFPVLFKAVRGADRDWIHAAPRAEVAEAFVEAGRELVAIGADGIAVGCGMMSVHQRGMTARVGVPVASSPLLQVATVQRLLPPGRRVGVVTISTRLLTPEHLAAADVPEGTPVVGCEEADEFIAHRKRADPTVDVARMEAEVLAAARRLVVEHDDVGAIVLECTNMAPYARTVSEATGRPTFDVVSFVTWFHAGLAPRDFGHPGSGPRPFRER